MYEINKDDHPDLNMMKAYANARVYIELINGQEGWKLKDSVSIDKQYLLDDFNYWGKKAKEYREITHEYVTIGWLD